MTSISNLILLYSVILLANKIWYESKILYHKLVQYCSQFFIYLPIILRASPHEFPACAGTLIFFNLVIIGSKGSHYGLRDAIRFNRYILSPKHGGLLFLSLETLTNSDKWLCITHVAPFSRYYLM